MSEHAKHCLERCSKYPYDHRDPRDDESDVTFDPPEDWAHYAARGVIADLCDRRGIKHGFNGVDEDVRLEIVQTLREIIATAHQEFKRT
jgi:hypothetical protein